MNKTIAKVGFQDLVIITIFLFLSCGIEKASSLIGGTTSFVVFLITWPVLFFLLFFSNSEVFKGVGNTYAWSIFSGIPSLLLAIGAIMVATHNACNLPFSN